MRLIDVFAGPTSLNDNVRAYFDNFCELKFITKFSFLTRFPDFSRVSSQAMNAMKDSCLSAV